MALARLRDWWWLQPLAFFLGLGGFFVYCNITTCCRQVCPENITITGNAIIPLKERVVDRYYDPLSRLFQVFESR